MTAIADFYSRLTKRQWITIAVFALADFCSAICVSLQAPFYPQEAEAKGASATEYGLVFGIFELTVFIVSPLLGQNLGRFGAKRVFNIGILTTGTCSVLFGLLDRIENGKWFIALSFIIRIVEAVGNSGFLTASFSIIAKEFPEAVGTMFACLETFFGIGLIVGPTVGGALYQVGGYSLPFVALGSLLIGTAILTHFVLPQKYDEKQQEDNGQERKKGMLDLLKVPSISLSAYSILCASITIGFIQATLEPHLRRFNLRPITVGAMFVVNGAMYAISAPIWGFVCDKKVAPIFVTTAGSILTIISFVFIGPAPFIPMDTILSVSIASLVVHGIGFAAELVAGFSSAHREAIAHGFADNLNTYALVSGLWTATFALGAFIGPSVAGLIVDFYGFRPSTLLVIVSQLTVLLFCVAFILHNKRRERRQVHKEDEEEDNQTVPLISASLDEDIGYDSFSNGSSDQIEKEHHHRRSRRPRRTRLNVPNTRRRHHSYSAVETTQVFSPSPLEPSPVSLLGGYMGISVPSTMNNIFEEIEETADALSNNYQGSSSFQATTHGQALKNDISSSNVDSLVVTAIVEDTSMTRPHQSGSIC